MLRLCCTAQLVAVLLLSGCGTAALFTEYEVNEDPSIEAAPWPRLVDTPQAPPVGAYTASVPDPRTGTDVNENLRTEAAVAAVRAKDLSAPILSEGGRNRMLRRAKAALERRKREEEQARREAAKKSN